MTPVDQGPSPLFFNFNFFRVTVQYDLCTEKVTFFGSFWNFKKVKFSFFQFRYGLFRLRSNLQLTANLSILRNVSILILSKTAFAFLKISKFSKFQDFKMHLRSESLPQKYRSSNESFENQIFNHVVLLRLFHLGKIAVFFGLTFWAGIVRVLDLKIRICVQLLALCAIWSLPNLHKKCSDQLILVSRATKHVKFTKIKVPKSARQKCPRSKNFLCKNFFETFLATQIFRVSCNQPICFWKFSDFSLLLGSVVFLFVNKFICKKQKWLRFLQLKA